MAYKQPKFISHSSGSQRGKIKAPANSLSSEKLLASKVSSSHGCNQTWKKEEGNLCGLSYKGTDPIYKGSTLII